MSDRQDMLGRLGAAILVAWVGFAISGVFASPVLAVLVGAGLGAACVVAHSLPGRARLVTEALIAVLAPFGVMLPALALRHVGVTLGLDVPGFSGLELVVFLAGYTLFLAAAFGVLPVDLYRYGYAGGPVAGLSLLVCSYALLTGNWFLALVVVLGQAAWVAGWSSENWFDTMLHVMLWPVALITLLIRLF